MRMNSTEFWEMVDDTRLQTEYTVDHLVISLQSASLEALQNIFLQYRYFTKYYSGDLGLLIFKAPDGKFKSLMAEILYEELGNGDPVRAHTKLLDNFLLGIGVNGEDLENSLESENALLLEEARQLMLANPPAYAIGLRGMGGECLCQIYLTAVFKQLLKNPVILKIKNNIDWTFWEIHTGEVDIEHRQKVRAAINEIVDTDPSSVEQIAAGYTKAKHAWDSFWANSHRLTHSHKFSRSPYRSNSLTAR